jgi:hypothetical protein
MRAFHARFPCAFAADKMSSEGCQPAGVQESASIRLWPPDGLEITDLLQPGENSLELRVANTLINLFEAVDHPTGLAGVPRLVAYNVFTLDLEWVESLYDRSRSNGCSELLISRSLAPCGPSGRLTPPTRRYAANCDGIPAVRADGVRLSQTIGRKEECTNGNQNRKTHR